MTYENIQNTNVIIAGVGGQGTVLAARLIGYAAMEKGLDVRGSETIGMAQRGGSVVSHIRIGNDIDSPLIPEGKADLIIAFEPGEAVRVLHFLKPGGTILACDRSILPSVAGDYDPEKTINWLTENVAGIHIVSGSKIIENCGARGLNVALLGAAIKLDALPFGSTELESAIRIRLNQKYIDMNIGALETGALLVS